MIYGILNLLIMLTLFTLIMDFPPTNMWLECVFVIMTIHLLMLTTYFAPLVERVYIYPLMHPESTLPPHNE
jgi:hypothetical protein